MMRSIQSNRCSISNALSFPPLMLAPTGVTEEREGLSPEERARDSQKPTMRLIVVPLDGSTHAEHALPHALAIARRSGATVRIVHVHSRLQHVESWSMPYREESRIAYKREKQDYLREVANRVARANEVTLETSLIESTDISKTLLQATTDADMVVMASRRRGLLRRLWSHSEAEMLRRNLRIPLLLVRGYSFPVDLTGDPIARHILMPLDGSAFAEHILGPTTVLSRLEGAKLTLLNVQDNEWTQGAFQHTNPRGYLQTIAHNAKRHIPVVGAHILTTDQSVATATISYAERHHVDLIAIATRADSGLPRFFRGSLVDAIVRRTSLPILVLAHDIKRKLPEITTVVD